MRISSQEHLDEIIQQGLREQGIANEHYRVYTAVQDSFSLVKYIKLTPLLAFQRLTLHYELHKLLYEYGVQLPGKVQFPEQDLHLYVRVNGTIFRTIRVRTNPELLSTPDSTQNHLPNSSAL